MTIIDHLSPAALSTVHDYADDVRHALGLTVSSLAVDLVERAFGRNAITFGRIRREAEVVKIDGRWRMVVRAGMPATRAHWAIALAFSRWATTHDGVDDVHVPTLAGALLLPQEAANELRRDGVESVAARRVVPLFATMLRAGELGAVETHHVVVGDVVRIRGIDRVDVAEIEAAAATRATPLRFVRRRSREERGVVLTLRRAA